MKLSRFLAMQAEAAKLRSDAQLKIGLVEKQMSAVTRTVDEARQLQT